MRGSNNPGARPVPQRTLRRRGMRRSAAVAAALAVMCGAAAACGDSGSSDGTSSGKDTAQAADGTVTVAGHKITADPALAAKVPAAIKSKGVLADITYNNAPPDEMIVDGKLVGWEVDLGAAVAAKLGLKWQVTASGAFDSFIPGLQNGRYNVSFTSFIKTPERLKQIDIVTYYNVGTGFAVKKGSPISIKAAPDLCGHSVAVIAGSAFIQQLKDIDCSGKAPVRVQSFPSQSAAELAVSSGRAEVYSSSMNQMAWLIKQTGQQFELQPLNYMPVPEGAGVTKGSGLAQPIADAIDQLIQSGVYKAIMNKWSINDGLVDKATVHTDGD